MNARDLSVGKLLFSICAAWALATAAHAADLGKVGDKVITDKDLRAYLTGLNESQRDSVLADPSSKVQVLRQALDQELLYQQAMKEKLDQSNDYRDAVENFRRQYLAGMVVSRKIEPQVTDAAARKYYSQYADRYSSGQVRAQHILLATREEAEKLLPLVQRPGADFQESAEKYSRDPSAKNNRGDLGFFPRGQYDPSFTEAAFNAEKGQIVGPVKTDFGWHLIKAIDFKSGRNLNFEEVELRVRNDLRMRLTQGFLDTLKKKTKVEVLSK
ncbi:MAG: peptidylprolyl isomerase [Bdellovibrionales bacterium]|nr:peptidylprolyl isomerase [Bdellovibrionales bacterium]